MEANKLINLIQKGIKNPGDIPSFVRRKPPISDLTGYGWRGLPLFISRQIHKMPVSNKQKKIIWEGDWDLLIILDCCRSNWMEAVASDFDWIDTIDEAYSIASHSREWMNKTFDNKHKKEMAKTIYITGNHYAENCLNPNDFELLENVNSYKDVLENSPVPPAHVVTDRAISLGRKYDTDRFIVHYMQPHKPFIKRHGTRYNVSIESEWSLDEELYRNYFAGGISKSELEMKFIQNLDYVLLEVEHLLNNFDAKNVVITSDHGQALGERFLWDHSPSVHHQSMRSVPWVQTTAVDRKTIEPKTYDTGAYDTEQIRNNLEKLGYI